jgi:DNA adenine methylase
MDGETMKLGAILPYFGCKRTLAKKVNEVLGERQVLWDVGCGSLAITFAAKPCRMETAVDLHGDVTNLAWVLQREETALDLYARTSRTMACESLFRRSQAVIRAGEWTGDVPDVERAYHFLTLSWQGRNGITGTRGGASRVGFAARFTGNGGAAAKRWASVSASVPAWHQRLLNVAVIRRDMFEILGQIQDKAGTAIYVDPPYIKEGHEYKHRFPSLEEETEDNPGHAALAAVASRFKHARVCISYYDHPALASLYPSGWDKIKLTARKKMGNAAQRGPASRSTSPEVLLVRRSAQRGFMDVMR